MRGSWFFVDFLAESFPPPPQLFGDTKFVRVVVTVMGPEEPKRSRILLFLSVYGLISVFSSNLDRYMDNTYIKYHFDVMKC